MTEVENGWIEDQLIFALGCKAYVQKTFADTYSWMQEAMLYQMLIRPDEKHYFLPKFILTDEELDKIPEGLTYRDIESRLDGVLQHYKKEYQRDLEDAKDG